MFKLFKSSSIDKRLKQQRILKRQQNKPHKSKKRHTTSIIHSIWRKLKCPRTYKYNKNLLYKEYYSHFDYENHVLNQHLMLKQTLKLEASMIRQHNNLNPYAFNNTNNNTNKYSYDNYTFIPSPSIQPKQHQSDYVSSNSIPTVYNNNIYEDGSSSYVMNTTFDKSVYSNTNYINNQSTYSATTTTTIKYQNDVYRNLSSKELDVKIKEIIFKLKLLYPKSAYLTQILMIESVYNIKMTYFKNEFDDTIKQFEEFEEATEQSRERRKPKRSRSITSNLAQSLCACSKLTSEIKKRKSSSITRDYQRASNEYLNNNLTITLPISASSLNNLNEMIQHKNYYKLERENLENRYEQLMCALQKEILKKIDELQSQIRYEQKLLNYDKALNTTQGTIQKNTNTKYQQNAPQHKQQVVTHDGIVYLNETPVERKIRKRRIMSKTNYEVNNTSNKSFGTSHAFQPINTNNQQLNVIKFYRNINVKETSV